MTPVTGGRILSIALPVVFANATVPLQGAVDTAIIGNVGTAASLAGVGIGASMFSLVISGFNFLQMGCSGLTAQALGAGDMRRVMHTLVRTLLIAAVIGAALLALQVPVSKVLLAFFGSGENATAAASLYFSIRIWGAPFELANYALLGWFAGQEMTRRLFQLQLIITLSNIALSLTLGVGMEMGLAGVAMATVLANGIGLACGLWLARARRRAVMPDDWRVDWGRITRGEELVAVMRLNRDIFIRSILLTGSFAWTMRLGAQQGELFLAANVILWQFLSLSAHALDGFAMAAETLVGQAKGAGNRAAFRRAAIMTSAWSGGLAVVFSLLLVVFGGGLIALLTDLPETRATAGQFMLWAALTPAVGFAAFQLDGIFIGATASREMRNAMIASAGLYIPLSIALAVMWGNHGVWAGIHLFFILRAIALLIAYTSVERSVAS